MKMYVYETESNRVVAVVTGETKEECERKAIDANYDDDQFCWTYFPDFEFNDGLIDNPDAVEL